MKRFFTRFTTFAAIFWCLSPSATLAKSCLECSEISNYRDESDDQQEWCSTPERDSQFNYTAALDPVKIQHGRASLSWQRVTRNVLHKLTGDDTRAFLGFPVSIELSNSPKPFAHAASASQMTISLGLLEIVENSDELAFILAHEIGHMALGHTREKHHSPTALQGSERSDVRDEVEADEFAITMMRSANFQAEAASNLLSKLGNYGAEYGVPLMDLYPTLSARIEQMQLRSNP